MVLRAYAKYLRQAGTTFSQDYIEQALIAPTPRIARLLVQLFEARFDPDRPAGRRGATDGLLEEIDGALDEVAQPGPGPHPALAA